MKSLDTQLNELTYQSLIKVPKIVGIERDNTMADETMYIPNYNKQNYSFCILLHLGV